MARGTSFSKVVICHTNDFKPDINNKIKQWIEANGGIFSRQLDHQVTHLITSKKAWKNYLPIVREARRMRTVAIVKYDWLEDSLLKQPVRALPVDKYLYEETKPKPNRRARNRKPVNKVQSAPADTNCLKIPRDKRIEMSGIEFDKSVQDFEQDMGCAGFHPYSDSTSFVYIITLLRYDIFRNRFEKHRLKVGPDPFSKPCTTCSEAFALPHLHCLVPSESFSSKAILSCNISRRLKSSSYIHIAEPWAQCLQLYESDETPHTYACYVQYTRLGISKQIRVLAPPGSTWDFAWSMFEKFFCLKVGKPWEQRPVNGTEINLDGIPANNQFYQYQTPKTADPEGERKSRVFEKHALDGRVDDIAIKSSDIGDSTENDFEKTNQASNTKIQQCVESVGQDTPVVPIAKSAAFRNERPHGTQPHAISN